MEVNFEKPKRQPLFEAVIYTTTEEPDVYRIMVGKEGTEANYHGEVSEFVRMSGLVERDNISGWVKEGLGRLPKGTRVEVDENFSYNMDYVLEQLAEESPVTINTE